MPGEDIAALTSVSPSIKNDSSAMSTPVPDCAGAQIAVDSHSVPRKRPFQLKVNSLVCTKIEPSELFTALPEYPLGLNPICSAHELSNKNQHSLQLPIKKTCPFYLMQFVMEKLLHAPRQPFCRLPATHLDGTTVPRPCSAMRRSK